MENSRISGTQTGGIKVLPKKKTQQISSNKVQGMGVWCFENYTFLLHEGSKIVRNF